MLILAGLQLIEQRVEALEVAFPDPAIILQPFVGLRERLAFDPAQCVRPTTRRRTSRARSRTRTCLDAAGNDIRSGAASSLKLRSPSASCLSIARRAGCARA